MTPAAIRKPSVGTRYFVAPARCFIGAALLFLGASALWTLPETLSVEGRLVLIVTLAAICGWVGTTLPDSLVAIAAAVALVMTGAIPEQTLFASLGSELVWLLLGAFLIAAVLKQSGVINVLMAPLVSCGLRFGIVVGLLTLAIAATAFVLPSTSARAALLLPVFTALLPALPHQSLARPLALLFPSVILLSAGSSLIGAGAHMVAVDAIAGSTDLRLGFTDWLRLGAPLGFLASGIAACLILWMFVPGPLWRARLSPLPRDRSLSPQQRRILILLTGLIVLWMTEGLHGISIALITLGGALILLTPACVAEKPKAIFRSIDTELLVYLAATMLIAKSMTATGADLWLAKSAMAVLPPAFAQHAAGIALALSVIAVLTHLVITSRSGRAAVLIPAVALPAAGLGHDAALTVLIVTMGTGFCQTMMASAKPVAIYGALEGAGFTQRDLMRLALPLAPLKVLLLVAFEMWVWPDQLADLRDDPASDHHQDRIADTALAR